MLDKSRLKLVIALMAVAAVIIIAMAVYIFVNFSNLGLSQGIVLGIIGVVALFLLMGVFFILVKTLNSPKKPPVPKK
jgi:hypothetical protein